MGVNRIGMETSNALTMKHYTVLSSRYRWRMLAHQNFADPQYWLPRHVHNNCNSDSPRGRKLHNQQGLVHCWDPRPMLPECRDNATAGEQNKEKEQETKPHENIAAFLPFRATEIVSRCFKPLNDSGMF